MSLVQPNNAAPQQVDYADPVAIAGNLSTDSTNIILSGSALGAADLTTGTARTYSSGRSIADGGLANIGLPQATANLSDSITVTGPGASVLLTLQFAVDGSIVPAPSSATVTGSFDQHITANCAIGTTQKLAGVVRVYSSQGSDVVTTSPLNDPAVIVTTNGSGGFTMSITIAVTVPLAKAVAVGCSLDAQGNTVVAIPVIADLANTGRMSLTLPAGYTYTSASGVLLSNAGGPGLGLDGGNAPSNADGGKPSGDAGGNTSGDGGNGAASAGGCSVGPTASAFAFGIFGSIALFGLWAMRRRAS